jgi:amidase
MLDFEHLTILDLQRAMDLGELSSVALTEHCLARIDALNPALNAVIAVSPDARADARHSDTRRRRFGARGPLEGIPVLIKDTIGTRGMPTTAGSLALLGAESADAVLVTRLRGAGAVILGKTNPCEWSDYRGSRLPTGWSAVGGQTRSPYVLDRNPWGSSSGSAVAVAAGLAPVAIGVETHCSIVGPAATNGVVGMRPTVGLVSRRCMIIVSHAQDTGGPIARNVTDAESVFSAIVDHARPVESLQERDLAGLRIGAWRAFTEPESDRIFAAAIEAVRGLGATVVEHVEVDVKRATRAVMVELRHWVDDYLSKTPGKHPRSLDELIRFNEDEPRERVPQFGQDYFERARATTGDLDDPDYKRDRATATERARAAIDLAIGLGSLDAIMAPTATPSPALRDDDSGARHSGFPAAIAGYPSITVPAGLAYGALPQGVSFFGAAHSEPTLFHIAYQFERATRARPRPLFLPTLGLGV